VQYKGKTYYVCCTGCRDAFLDDPEGILEEYAERVAKRKKGK
jgi:YHS domain-containing protein